MAGVLDLYSQTSIDIEERALSENPTAVYN